MLRSVAGSLPVHMLWMLLVMALPGGAVAKIEPNMLFTDGAVLQQDMPLPIWGTTDSDEPVNVSLPGQKQSATPKDGKWLVTFEPLKQGAPFEIKISQGNDTVIVKNLLAGEVWLCGGQSNMQWTVAQSSNAKETIASAGNDKIRLFTVDRPKNVNQTPNSDRWLVCSPENVKEFTAVGYAFGRELQHNLAVPVGLLSSNVGGTTAERWISKETLERNPDLKGMTAPQGKSDLYDAMIKPLAPFAIRGAIWYQGESNSDRPFHYRKVLSAMIQDWRSTFGGDFPFLIVQLAPFEGMRVKQTTSDWAILRESQNVTAKNLPKTATVVITDLGDAKDIHPVKKSEVGRRLALAARALQYGEKIEYSGPVFERMQVEDGKAFLRFTHRGDGLASDAPLLTGFTIAGEDRKFAPAEARIEGKQVVVSSTWVDRPVAVRYGWSNMAEGNLKNKENLPASPFRTDDWPVEEQDKR